MPVTINAASVKDIMAIIGSLPLSHNILKIVINTCKNAALNIIPFFATGTAEAINNGYYRRYYEHACGLPFIQIFSTSLRQTLHNACKRSDYKLFSISQLESSIDEIVTIIIASYMHPLNILAGTQQTSEFPEIVKFAHCIAARLYYHYQHYTGQKQPLDERIYTILCEARKDHHIETLYYGKLHTVYFQHATDPKTYYSFSDFFKRCLVKPFDNNQCMVHYTLLPKWQGYWYSEIRMPLSVAIKLGFRTI